jgi:hypothetical protein
VAVVGLILAGLVAALLLRASAVSAADASPARPAPSDLALVPPDALAMVHVRVADLWQSEIGKAVRQFAPEEMFDGLRELEKLTGTRLDEMDRLTVVVVARSDLYGWHKGDRDSDPGPVLIVRTLRPYTREKVLEAVLGESREETYRGKIIYTSAANRARRAAVHLVDDHVLAVAENAALLRPLLRHAVRPQAEGLLSPALAAAGQKHLVVAGVSPFLASFYSFSGSVGPREQMMIWTFQHVARAEGITLLVDSAGSKVQASVDLAFADERWARWALPAARAALGMVRDALAEAVDELGGGRTAVLARVLGQVEAAVTDARPEQVGAAIRATVAVDIPPEQLKAALTEGAAQARQAADRAMRANNLKQIGLALLHHDVARGRLSPAITDKQGKPLLSWRVAILPYLEHDQLYRQFRLDEPWDSDHNKKLAEKMPPIYSLPGVKTKEPFTTFYQGFAGPGTVFGDAKGITMAQIRDGASNTIMVVEAGEAVHWTKPEDLPYDPQKPLPRLGAFPADGFHAVLCDGSVHLLRRDADPMTLRRAITINDGFFIDLDKLTLAGPRAPRTGEKVKATWKKEAMPKPPSREPAKE